jgi:glycosyltransferase involved in cell wall biosynthesis
MKSKILLFSTGDVHGAYEAIYRIGVFLEKAGHQVCLMVKEQTKNDIFIRRYIETPKGIKNQIFEKIRLKKIRKVRNTDNKYLFLNEDESWNYISNERILDQLPFIPDLIISGMTNGFINTTNLEYIQNATRAKVFFLTVDMIPLTGGCHYSWGCKGYKFGCTDCPAVFNEADKKWVKNNYDIKFKNINKGKMGIIAGSGLTLEQARESLLFKNQNQTFNINSCIDTQLFNSKKRSIAKSIFDIPENTQVIFSGSLDIHDPRKGFEYFKKALAILYNLLAPNKRENVYILIAGNDVNSKKLDEIPFKKHFLTYIKDYRLLSLLYQASDVFVCSSIEDSGPMMVSEALACGTPVAGFNTGILTNMVINNYNGFKTDLKDSMGLAHCIKSILELSKQDYGQFSKNAVYQVEQHSSQDQVIKIVNKLLSF